MKISKGAVKDGLGLTAVLAGCVVIVPVCVVGGTLHGLCECTYKSIAGNPNVQEVARRGRKAYANARSSTVDYLTAEPPASEPVRSIEPEAQLALAIDQT